MQKTNTSKIILINENNLKKNKLEGQYEIFSWAKFYWNLIIINVGSSIRIIAK